MTSLPLDRRGPVPPIVCALAVLVVAVVGGLAAGSARRTYQGLDLPVLAPPGWLFGPVWSVLYVMIGVAGWLIWRTVGWERAMTWYAVQLVLNLVWTPLFFGADAYAAAAFEIVVLLASIVVLIALAWSRSRLAAWLLVPYACWVAFATYLSISVWALN